VDIDVFVTAHRAEWDRLRQLSSHAGRLSGPEADELVRLYQRAATHLSIVRTETPDPALVARLSTLVAQARSAITGTDGRGWRDIVLFFTQRLPAALYLGRRWWIATALVFIAVTGLIAVWIASNPDVQGSIAAPAEIEQLTRPGGEFETYYSSNPAASFAFKVWTNNAWVAASCLLLGVLFGLPVVYALWMNALNTGLSAGLMVAAGRGEVFLGLIAPHGILELTAVFVAAGIGMRLGWTVVDPGGRTRSQALAAEGRSVVAVALGLVCVLAVSGVIEAFVTPSGWPTWVRVGIGVLVETLFLLYVFVVGRRAARAGVTGDVDSRYAGDSLPVSV
jgi:uncharacterized membrane protein SpoIIM required for sporulation